jgi:hypothetical protein
MNERIKELAQQADGVFIHKLITGAKQYTFLEKDLEKFAELIVKECVATMYKRGEAYAHPSAGFYQAKTFSEAIMEHFGVEE